MVALTSMIASPLFCLCSSRRASPRLLLSKTAQKKRSLTTLTGAWSDYAFSRQLYSGNK